MSATNLSLNRTDSMNASRTSGHGSPKAAAHSPYGQQVLHASDMLEKPSSQPMTGGNGYYGCSSNSSNSDSGEHEHSSNMNGSSTTPTYPIGNYNYQQQPQQYSPYQQQQQQGSYPGSPYQQGRGNGSGNSTPSRHNSGGYGMPPHQMLPAAMSQQQQQQQQTSSQPSSYANAAPPPPPSYVQATVTANREWSNNTPPQQEGGSQEGTPLNRHNSNTNFSQSQNSSQNNRSNPKNNNSSHRRNNSSPHPTVEGCPEGAYHSALFGKCEWIQPPPVPQVDLQTPAFPCYRLFLGQIRFETTPAEVGWIIEYVTGVQALKVETRGIGCFLAYFQAYDDMVAVQGLHKRILFDHTGIWFARSDEQAQQMQDYVRAALGRIGRGFRLPKDMMVVEEEKLQRALPIPSAPPQYNFNPNGPTYSSFNGAGAVPQQQPQRVHTGPQQQQQGLAQLPEYDYTPAQ